MNDHSNNPGQRPDEARTNASLAAHETFPVFAEWMDLELRKLEARFIHLAAPNAARSARNVRRRMPKAK